MGEAVTVTVTVVVLAQQTDTADMAVDADGRWVFLESNSAGQYFWLETHTGAPITAALTDLPAQGTQR